MASKITRIVLIVAMLAGLTFLWSKSGEWRNNAREQASRPDPAVIAKSEAIIRNLQISDLKGKATQLPGTGRDRLINYWATWCGPCIKEMPILKGLLAPYHDRKRLQILLISETLNRATLERFLIRQEQTLPAADYYQSTTRALRQALGIEQQPLTLLLDSDGVVRQVSDQEIMDAKARVGAGGLGCEPASAASVACGWEVAAMPRSPTAMERDGKMKLRIRENLRGWESSGSILTFAPRCSERSCEC